MTMVRRTRPPRPEATHAITLTPLKESCEQCGQPLWVGYHGHRTVTKLDGLWKLTIVVRRCMQPQCPYYHRAYRPEEEGRWALPHGEFGLEVIALIGHWRFREHRSVPEMHRALLSRGVSITQRSVTNLMQRYEELVALRVANHERIKQRLQKQGRVILAIDGLQPDVGHEVLWVVRDCLSEEILLARPLLSSSQGDLTTLLTEVKGQLDQLKVPVKGVISDGEETLGSAVAFVFPKVPHQLCQFHYLKDAYALVYQAAHILANHEQQTGAQVRETYLDWVKNMQEQKASLGTLSTTIDHFVEITDNFAAGLFECYDVPDLPRTNNDLEHCFGVARAHERRATGRRGAIPGVVVRGSVRLMAVVVTQHEDLQAADLQPRDYQKWRDLRTQLRYREEARRQQFRFRKDPAAYLAALETQLLE